MEHTPEVYEDERICAGFNRESNDQEQVSLLNEKGYRRMMDDLRLRYH
ncbi:MAG: hypothetical protein AAFX93_09895 [Verrucomicrobiota bacterium]